MSRRDCHLPVAVPPYQVQLRRGRNRQSGHQLLFNGCPVIRGRQLCTAALKAARSVVCRDALHLGDCDDAVRELCRMLGWQDDLAALIGAEAVSVA